VLSLKVTTLEHEALAKALTAAGCTQLKAAQELTLDSSVLQSLPKHLRSPFTGYRCSYHRRYEERAIKPAELTLTLEI
jgi:hypothetical protein